MPVHPPVTPAKVVVIENDAQVREAIHGLLTECGYDVVEFATTRLTPDALATAAGCLAIITDYHLGEGESGLDLAKRIGGAEAGQVPILLTSGSLGRHSSAAGREEGVTLLFKPVDPEAMLRWLDAAVATSHINQAR